MASWKLTWLYLRKRYKVVEVSCVPEFMIFIAIVPRLLGAMVILNFLDHTADYFKEKYSVSFKHIVVRLLLFLERTSARWADHVLCTQSVTRDLLVSRGVPKSKITVIVNVPDEAMFNRDASISNRIDDGKFRLLTHGSLLEIYGIQTLINAVPLLIKEIPQLNVRVIGDGEYRPYLEQLARSLEITEYIDFPGIVPQVEIPKHITQADIGVVTVHCEFPALSNKLFEYLAMGIPAVVTSISANKAYFDDNSVMFFEPDNEHELTRCILELYRNPEKRTALAAAGSATYQKYRWSIIKYDYLRVYDKLIKGEDLSSP
jgi:glycosyltransferase involved in cell wall biosynthesis